MRLITACAATRRYNAIDSPRQVFFTVMAVAVMVALAGLLQQAKAQQDIAPPGDDIPRYTVELIVFTYGTVDSSSSEIFVPDKPKLVPGADDFAEADSPPDAFGDIPGEASGSTGPEGADRADGLREIPAREHIELQLLEPDAYTMDEIYRKLDSLDAYDPIMRTAWTQTTPAKEVSPAVHLRALGSPPLGLDGSVTLYLGRYLHLVVDLALDADPDRQAMTATDRLVAYGDGRVRNDDATAEFDGMLRLPVRYRIVEDRIMKTGDIRYFDHPRFGVVAKVTKANDNANAGGGIAPGVN